jgi:peptidoglycan/xylan/chitin deacetylase (PgdA/CDA1 family)
MKLRYLVADSSLSRVFLGIAHRRHASHKTLLKILIYHDVPAADRDAFRAHVQYIRTHYGFITLDDLKSVIAGKAEYTGTKVLLTFDDGFHSNAVVAKQILDPLGIKALFFIPPRFIETKNRAEQRTFMAANIFLGGLVVEQIPDAMKPMTWEDLKELLDHGHAIGAHTINHRRLTEIGSERELRREIVESGDILHRRLGTAVEHFAYPFGGIDSIDPRAKAIIKERYAYCYSGIRGVNVGGTDPHALLRDPVSLADPVAYVRFIMEDGLGLMYRKRALSIARY